MIQPLKSQSLLLKIVYESKDLHYSGGKDSVLKTVSAFYHECVMPPVTGPLICDTASATRWDKENLSLGASVNTEG